jgi:hypothetical protein
MLHLLLVKTIISMTTIRLLLKKRRYRQDGGLKSEEITSIHLKPLLLLKPS